MTTSREGKTVRLKSIVLEGFRGFTRRVEIDLDADVVLLHGPNGAGKTSLLDGVLWCLSGKIDRFQSPRDPISLYSRDGSARVSLTLSHDGDDLKIVRAFDGKQESVRVSRSGEEVLEGASAESCIADLLLPGARGRQDAKSALSQVLTRGVYLQQDLVRQFVEADRPSERFEMLSQIVGGGVVLHLQQELERSRANWARNISSLRKELEPAKQRLEEIEVELSRLTNEADLPSIDARTSSKELYDKSVALLGTSRLPLDGPPTTSGSLDRLIRQLNAERARIEREIETVATLLGDAPDLDHPTLLSEIDRLKGSEAEHAREIETIEGDIQSVLSELAELRRAQVDTADRANRLATLARIALQELHDTCPVCQQTYDHDATAEHLHNLITIAQSSGETDTSELEGRLSELTVRQSRTRQEAEALAKQRAELERREVSAATRRELRITRLADLGLDENKDVPAALAERRTGLGQTLERLASLVRMGEQLSISVVKLSEQRRRAELSTSLEVMKARVRTLADEIGDLERTHHVAGQIIEGLRGASMTVTEDQVDRASPLFQRIYSRIDPHPTFRVTQIFAKRDRGRGHIDVSIVDPDQPSHSYDAGPILSSSQLNSFAVSLFLALNLSMRTIHLALTVLDDPLQSLDTINLLGLVDVLRRIREHRQIIVSTHEERLLGLLQRKLRPVQPGERMTTITFSDWTKEGPRFDAVAVEASGADDRVLAA